VISPPVAQPIWLVVADDRPSTDLAAEILRCEGFPWFQPVPLERLDEIPPKVKLVVVAGTGLSSAGAQRLARCAAHGTPLVVLAPDSALAVALGLSLAEPATDAHVRVVSLPGWEHGDTPLLCPGDGARPLAGGHRVAALCPGTAGAVGTAIARVRLGQERVWFYGYDLCQAIASLRHGSGRLDPPPDQERTWSGPRALYSFWELADKLPHDVPVADLHQDALRSIIAEALADTVLPRLWHFPEAAPALWFVRGDGCGEEGAQVEVDVLEKHGAFLSFCRPLESRHSGELMRQWHARGHGISIEANINHITMPTVADGSGAPTRERRTASELNTKWLSDIRAHLVEHRDSFERDTGLGMETFMTHSAQWTGLPMAEMVSELGWRMLLPFQCHDPRVGPGDRQGPYLIPTGLPMRYFDSSAGVLDLWHIPYHWIDIIWQMVAGRRAALQEGEDLDAPCLRRDMGLTGEQYGEQLVRFAEDAARKWHGAQLCSFHPCYVAFPQPILGSSRQALEMGLAGARAAGCRFENLERWARFVRGRDAVRLTAWWADEDTEFLTLSTGTSVAGLTLLLPDRVTQVRSRQSGARIPVRRLDLEGRTQSAIQIDLQEDAPITLCLK